MRVGLLTAGGDCPGLNAVIRVITQTLIVQCRAEVFGFENGFAGLIDQRLRILDLPTVANILGSGGTILGTHNKANPFAYFAGDGADVSNEVCAYIKRLGLDALVVIGGDGSMSIAHRLSQKGVPIVGCPKTIDNDLVHTDRTFGFDTAVSVATEALDRLQTTAQSHSRVMILETMGRYTGWISLYAGLAGGAHIILIPELPFDLHKVAKLCLERERNQGYTLIVIAEGATQKDGELLISQRLEDSHDPIRLGGVSHHLRIQLQPLLNSEVRATVLGHLQRGANPTAFDRLLATQFGHAAAKLIIQGQFNRLVTLEGNQISTVPLEAVADQIRRVPLNHPLLQTAWDSGVCSAH